ncbi:hypothetical protein Tco_0753991 [Tanacetum coccineum]
MTTLMFADTHNMVAFLSKPTECDGFEQIVDFLNAYPIRYALMVNPTIYTSCIEQFWSTVKAKTINGEAQLHALVDGKKIIITEASVRRDLKLADEEECKNVINEVVHKELGDSLVRTATTASSLEAEQDSGAKKTIGDTIAQTRFENVSKHSNDSLLARGNTLQSDEDRLKLDELMALCTTLQNRVLDLEKTKTTQHNGIASLKRRVKKLKKKNRMHRRNEGISSSSSLLSGGSSTVPQCLSEEYEDYLRRSHEDFQPLPRIFTKTIFTPEEPGALYKRYQLKANQTPIRMDKSDAWRSVAQDLELSAAKEAVKAMRNLQAIIQCKAQICFGQSTKDNHWKGFLEDDESSDDSILIVDPGWDDYCLQELKLNRPVPLCPEARRARM